MRPSPIRSTALAIGLGLAVTFGLGIAPAAAAGVGVVLIHLRGGWPGEFDNIVPKLEAAGYATIAPEMCWSVHRLYPGTLDECQGDIDFTLADLKGRGVDRIVLAGHDLGGMAAAYYAARHP